MTKSEDYRLYFYPLIKNSCNRHEKCFYFPSSALSVGCFSRCTYYRGYYGRLNLRRVMLRARGVIDTPKPASIPVFLREAEVEVVFGTPSQNCEGNGICMVTSRFPMGYTVPCPHARAIIYCDKERKELVFRFPKRHLSEIALMRLKDNGVFIVEEPFRIPQILIRRWGLPGRYIPAGRYPIEAYFTEWRLYFPWPRD